MFSDEWKTRFETQQEMNEQLERQCELLQQKIEDAHKTLSDGKLVEKKTRRKNVKNKNRKGKRSARVCVCWRVENSSGQ